MLPKSGLNPGNILFASSSTVIQPPPNFVLDLLPSDTMIICLCCWMKLIWGSALVGSLKFIMSSFFLLWYISNMPGEVSWFLWDGFTKEELGNYLERTCVDFFIGTVSIGIVVHFFVDFI